MNPLPPLLVSRFLWLPALAVMAATILFTSPLLSWPVADWAAVSARTHTAVVYAGPLAAATSCLLAARFNQRQSLLASPVLARAGSRLAAAQFLSCLGTLLVGYLLGLAPVLADAVTRASWGSLDLLALASGGAALVGYTAAGYLAGTVLPSPLLPPIVALVTFLAIQLPAVTSPDRRSLLTPMDHSPPEAGFHENPTALLFRIGWFALVAAVGWYTAGLVLADRRPDRRWPGRWALLPPLVPLLAAVVAVPVLATGPVPDVRPAAYCRDLPVARICLHPAHRSNMDEVARITTTLLTLTGRGGGTSPSPLLVNDQALAGPATVQLLLPASQRATDYVAAALTDLVTGARYCPEPADDSRHPRQRLADVVAGWLQTRSGVAAENAPYDQDLSPRLAAVPDQRVTAWLSTHRTELARCGLTEAALP